MLNSINPSTRFVQTPLAKINNSNSSSQYDVQPSNQLSTSPNFQDNGIVILGEMNKAHQNLQLAAPAGGAPAGGAPAGGAPPPPPPPSPALEKAQAKAKAAALDAEIVKLEEAKKETLGDKEGKEGKEGK